MVLGSELSIGHPESKVKSHESEHAAQTNIKYHTSYIKPLTFWFHAASLGEFEQGRPVIEAVRLAYPNARIVLTFFSPSGYEIKKDYAQVDVVCYLPADTAANVNHFLDAVQPDIALFIKYEFWYNYLHELKKREIKTLLFSAIFRPNQLFFKWYGGFYRKMIFCFDTILVQNQTSAALLNTIGYYHAVLAGDTRLDRVVQIATQANVFPEIVYFKGESPLLVVGSAWPDDMSILIPFLNNFHQPIKIIIAPHEINTAQIEQWQKQLTVYSSRFTDYLEREEKERPTHSNPTGETVETQNARLIPPLDGMTKSQDAEPEILFLNTIGMLSSIYRYADFAYIGGAFGDGLHNILEPAAFGMPIFFGKPYFQKFQEAHDLLQLGGAISVGSVEELTNSFEEVYENLSLRKEKATICRDYVQSNRRATEKVMEVIESGVIHLKNRV